MRPEQHFARRRSGIERRCFFEIIDLQGHHVAFGFRLVLAIPAAAMVANAMAEHTKQKTVKSLADYNHLINAPHPTEVLEASGLIDAAHLGLGLGPEAKKKSS